MARSALAGVFREFTLTYKTPTGGTTTDAYGNPQPETEDATLTITFEASQAPQLIFQPGSDPKTVRGRGTCINPVTLPASVGPGSELVMTWNGHAGTLRILQVALDPLEVLDDVLGQSFAAEWRP